MNAPRTLAEAAFVRSRDGRVLLSVTITGEEADERELDTATLASRLASGVIAAVLRAHAPDMERGKIAAIQVTVQAVDAEEDAQELAARLLNVR